MQPAASPGTKTKTSTSAAACTRRLFPVNAGDSRPRGSSRLAVMTIVSNRSRFSPADSHGTSDQVPTCLIRSSHCRHSFSSPRHPRRVPHAGWRWGSASPDPGTWRPHCWPMRRPPRSGRRRSSPRCRRTCGSRPGRCGMKETGSWRRRSACLNRPAMRGKCGWNGPRMWPGRFRATPAGGASTATARRRTP